MRRLGWVEKKTPKIALSGWPTDSFLLHYKTSHQGDPRPSLEQVPDPRFSYFVGTLL